MQTIRRRRLGAQAWRELLSRFGDSRLTTTAFCRREAVSTAIFYRWRTRNPLERCRVERCCPCAKIVSSRLVEAHAQNLHAASDACTDGIMHVGREVGGKVGFDRNKGVIHSVGDEFDGISD